ncbi:MAG: ABC transporter ATP-binding protein [Halodesulfovibrio sp.]
MQFDIDIEVRLGDCRKSLFCRKEGRVFELKTRLACDVRNLVLAGPSGSGKSITLQAVAGLVQPDSGRIAIGNRVFYDSVQGINVLPQQRRIGYVFQDYALFPHCTVRENVVFGMKRWSKRLSREELKMVDEVLDVFGLGQIAEARPAAISGGQRQRTALARALASRPEVLLLDEPFSALDQPLRLRMREELARILNHYSIPMILVTHDIDEACYFADTVAVYAEGGVRDILDAEELAGRGENMAGSVGTVIQSAYNLQ